MNNRETIKQSITLAVVFASITAVTLGGGLIMLPIMQREFVEKRKWLSEEEMLDTIAVMQSLPGIIVVNMSTMIGYRVAGLAGAIFALVGALLPPFAAILLVLLFLGHFFDAPWMQNLFSGVRAAACALILLSLLKMGKKALKGPVEIILGIISFLAMVAFKLNAVWMILFGAVFGLVWQSLRMRQQLDEKPAKEEK